MSFDAFKATGGALLRIALGVLVGCALIWHLLPHFVWALKLEPELERAAGADALNVPFVHQLPPPRAGWTRISHGRLELRAPLLDPAALCADPFEICQLDLALAADRAGRLVIHRAVPFEGFQEMVWLRAPDRSDLSLLRGARENWQTIQALRQRVTTSRGRLESWRFETDSLKGVVAEPSRGKVATHLIAAYDRAGYGTRLLAASNLSREDVLSLLGSLRFSE